MVFVKKIGENYGEINEEVIKFKIGGTLVKIFNGIGEVNLENFKIESTKLS